MSIQSAVDNFVHDVSDFGATIFNNISSQLENIVGTAITGLSNLWSGGFVGMSEEGMAELKEAVEKYCQSIDEIIAGFDETGDITGALKGETQEAAVEFIESIKQLLQAYVSTTRQEISDADEAWANWQSSSQSIASDVTTDANDIRSNAEKISLD